MARENTHLDPRFVRHNLIAFTVEYIAFGTAIAFLNTSVVLPKLLDDLGATSVFIGLVSSAINIVWLGAQFFGGAVATHFKKIKNMMWTATLIGRPILMLYGLLLYLNRGQNPAMLRWVLLAVILIMFSLDSFSGTAWYDISGRTFPGSKRSGIIATWGIFSAFAGFFVAGAISRILGPAGPAFPDNYALLFLCASVFLTISLLAWGAIKDPPQEKGYSTEIIPIRQLPTLMADLLRKDRNLRNAVLSKMFLGLASMGIPFYVLYAIDVLHLPEATIAYFITAQMVGTILGNAVMGWIGNKWGPKRSILFAAFIYGTAPILAIAIGGFGALSTWQGILYLWVYLCVSVVTNVSLIGHSSYVMDIAPDGKIPVYMSTLNSISALGMFGPLIGGFLVRVFSYQTMFLSSLIPLALMVIATLRLRRVTEVQTGRNPEAPLPPAE